MSLSNFLLDLTGTPQRIWIVKIDGRQMVGQFKSYREFRDAIVQASTRGEIPPEAEVTVHRSFGVPRPYVPTPTTEETMERVSGVLGALFGGGGARKGKRRGPKNRLVAKYRTHRVKRSSNPL